ncbi:hypothetical protein EJ04DRAFT_136417 [Polyplosphaeria fusca]|uniref:Uncharacterized protein n=1 Tax=Polyplosphaeria fusca TaxID=682080 RepID=A0A9P4QL85_9PLEO|nr:hypothetical protein EJ04DRAFT_136417 [Polyplosphaeria fusca]
MMAFFSLSIPRLSRSAQGAPRNRLDWSTHVPRHQFTCRSILARLVSLHRIAINVIAKYMELEKQRSCDTFQQSSDAGSTTRAKMQFHILNRLAAVFFLLTLALANPLDEAAAIRAAPADNVQIRQIQPSGFTTERTANTEFAPPTTPVPPDPSATGTQTTSHEANTEIVPSAGTGGTGPPLVTTDSRSANTQAIGPFTGSSVMSDLAMPTGAVRMDVVLGAVAVGIAGMV